jgi:hypothetical protein
MPDYFREKIKLFIALAPVARVDNMKSGFLKFLKNAKFHKILKATNQFEVFPGNEVSNNFNRWISKNLPSISNLALEMISDDNINNSNNDRERVGVYLSHYPAGASLQSLNHFIQNLESKNFLQYDYKTEANMRIYGTPFPGKYDLDKVYGVPIALFGGKDDKLACEEDIEWLREKLERNVIFYNIYEKMGHLTFLLSKDISWFDDALVLIEAFRGEIKDEEIQLKIDEESIKRKNSSVLENKKSYEINLNRDNEWC